MFNTDEYAWVDLKLVFGGRPVTGFRGAKFSEERTVTHIYAAGNKPVARTKGNKVFKGEFKFLQSEIEAMIESAQALKGPLASITDITYDATLAFVPELGAPIKVHQLVSVDITGFEMGMMQNDGNMEITLPVMIGDVLLNV